MTVDEQLRRATAPAPGRGSGEAVAVGDGDATGAPERTAPAGSGATAAGSTAAREALWVRLRRGAVWTVLASLVGGLVLPAVQSQWSDRPAELAMKKELISDITRASVDTVTAAQCIVTYCAPEFAAYTADPSAERNAELQLAWQRLNRETVVRWKTDSAVSDVLIRTYFPGSRLASRWASFSDTVLAFLDLASTACGAQRAADTALLRASLPGVPEGAWADLARGLNDTCTNTPPDFPGAYAEVGEQVLKLRTEITDEIVQANAAGYSSGWRDFIGDLYPF